jgi:hypothetical protein
MRILDEASHQLDMMKYHAWDKRSENFKATAIAGSVLAAGTVAQTAAAHFLDTTLKDTFNYVVAPLIGAALGSMGMRHLLGRLPVPSIAGAIGGAVMGFAIATSPSWGHDAPTQNNQSGYSQRCTESGNNIDLGSGLRDALKWGVSGSLDETCSKQTTDGIRNMKLW